MYKINISIDDISPHPLSSAAVLDRCYELIEEFPQIKFTLFVPFAYWRTVQNPGKPDTISAKPFLLHRYPEFCDTIRNLSKDNFELGYHGLFHGIPGKNNNDEFKTLSYNDAAVILNTIKKIELAAGLSEVFSPIFRPPAWKMSPESFKACSDVGIDIFALSSEDYALRTYADEHLNYKHVFFDSSPPNFPLELKSATEIVYHACEWDVNYLNSEKTEELKLLLKENIDKLEFCFMDGMLNE